MLKNVCQTKPYRNQRLGQVGQAINIPCTKRIVVDRFDIELFAALKQTHYARTLFYMSD